MRVDKVGLGLSVLCILHCITPAALMLIGVNIQSHFGSFWPVLHWLLIVPIAVVILRAFWMAAPCRATAGARFLATMGFILLIAALLSHAEHLELWFTVLGSVLIIVAHLSNIFTPAIEGHRSSSCP